MNRSDTVDRQFAKPLAVLALLFASAFQCAAQSQDQAGTAPKATGKDDIIACRFSPFDMFVDVQVKDQKGNGVTGLGMKNFLIYEDGFQQVILSFLRIGGPLSSRYSLYYEPINPDFDGKRRKVRIEARTADGRKLRVSSRLRPDPDPDMSFKIGVYPQSYSVKELPRKK
jgi:hypothetical protein